MVKGRGGWEGSGRRRDGAEGAGGICVCMCVCVCARARVVGGGGGGRVGRKARWKVNPSRACRAWAVGKRDEREKEKERDR